MIRTTVFRSNGTQAVRLPQVVELPADVHEVEIVAVGESRVITPAGGSWLDHFSSTSRPTDDFMAKREQPDALERTQE